MDYMICLLYTSVAFVNMKLAPEGGLDVNLRVGVYDYNKHFDKLPAVLPTDAGTFGFTLRDSLSNGRVEGQNTIRNISAIVSQPFVVAKGYQGVLNIAPTSKTTSVAVVSLMNTNIQRGQDFINKLMEMYNRNTNNDKTVSYTHLDVYKRQLYVPDFCNACTT